MMMRVVFDYFKLGKIKIDEIFCSCIISSGRFGQSIHVYYEIKHVRIKDSKPTDFYSVNLYTVNQQKPPGFYCTKITVQVTKNKSFKIPKATKKDTDMTAENSSGKRILLLFG